MAGTTIEKDKPPKDGLVRAIRPGLEVRAAEGDDTMPTLFGYMLRFNEWTEIDSLFEGCFLERISPGAAKKTLEENRDKVKILFNHGYDPHIGEKTLAPPDLTEDKEGVHYEGELFDTSYNRDLVPGLEANQYGASFKFRVVKETFDEEPEESKDNPDGLPERTIEELKLYEGGPVTFPAYGGASAGVRMRSLTDRMFFERLKQDPSRMPELAELFAGWIKANPERAAELVTHAQEMTETTEPAVEETSPGEDTQTDEEPPVEGTPAPVEETGTETEDEESSTDALSGAEGPHSAGSRAPTSRPMPPWHQSQKTAPPWRGDKRS